MTDELLTTRQVAALCGLSPQRVAGIARDQHLGQKYGGTRLYTMHDVTIIKSRRRVGRPSKGN